MNFADLKNEQIRLTILHLLTTAPGYEANDSELGGLVRTFGHKISHDALRTQLAWLAEQGLLIVETVSGARQVAKLTLRGEDAAYGRAIIPGVKRPGPEDTL